MMQLLYNSKPKRLTKKKGWRRRRKTHKEVLRRRKCKNFLAAVEQVQSGLPDPVVQSLAILFWIVSGSGHLGGKAASGVFCSLLFCQDKFMLDK